jgi:DNA topoisomerase IB
MTRLHRVSCESDGISRRRRGRGFEYFDAKGRRITDAGERARIRALAIPPAWTEVWICADPNGHLQAVGADVAGRRQYLYHPRWRARRDRQKFERMLAFARVLPRVRRVVGRDLRSVGLTRERALACAVRLLDRGFFRIGNDEYAETNGSFGLTTLERRHVSIGADGELVFDYTAKGGVRRVQTIADAEASAVVVELKRRRSPSRGLLAYRNSRWTELHAEDVNAYLKDAAAGDFTAKDFRTWHATVLAAVALSIVRDVSGQAERRRAIASAAADVADRLGNTPAVCRASYIDPRIFDRYLGGETIATTVRSLDEFERAAPPTQRRIERAVLALLGTDRASPPGP